MIKNIMIATDGSETSEKAAKAGIDIARRSAGSVTVVYVMDIFRLAYLPGYTTLPGIKEQLLELMKKEGKEATDFAAELAMKAGVPCNKIVAEGSPSEELLKISRESGMDLLVMGSVGRTGLDRFLLGSVAEKVVRNSTVPVLLIRE
ncbi:Universal stress protein [uncultured archaeon]|nr:Universal stress protein [uncultured archaeon]